jgi:hypothetical protein
MKLSEIKVQLIQTFFTEDLVGVPSDQIDEIFESLGKLANIDLSLDKFLNISQNSIQSADPSKAFKKFTEGKISLITITEDDGSRSNVIFAAVRTGKTVFYVDLTKSMITEKQCDFSTVKQAIRQAKNINDDVYYNIMSK